MEVSLLYDLQVSLCKFPNRHSPCGQSIDVRHTTVDQLRPQPSQILKGFTLVPSFK
jgi:hypothetical protein